MTLSLESIVLIMVIISFMNIDTDYATAFSIIGDGAPVVLIHGLGLTNEMWGAQVKDLTQQFTVLRYDLLGHGLTSAPAGELSVDTFVDQLIKLLEFLNFDQVALVGFSLGGIVARAFTIKYPKLVRALVLLNTAHNRTEEQRQSIRDRAMQVKIHGPASTINDALERWFTKEFLASRIDVQDQFNRWLQSNNSDVYSRVYSIFADADKELVNSISQIMCPTLIVACEGDYGNSPQMAKQMAEHIKDSRATIIPNLKHMGLFENPSVVNASFIPFLRSTLM